MKSTPAFLAIALSAFLMASCATEPSLYTGDTAYYGYTWEQELELGEKADRDIVKEMGLYQNDAVSAYVQDLGQRLLQYSAMRQPDVPDLYRNTEFTFRVLDSPVVNAFALPGGYVYVTRGLLAHVENEAQLAVVIGHEITHVEARHASKQALTQQWGKIGLLAGALIGETVAENKEFARQALNLGGDLFQLATLKYGRDAERESDLHGVEYAAKAGYDAAQGADFFKTLQRISEKSGQRIPTWMSSHPDPGERESTVKELSQQWTDEGHPMTVGREAYLNRIEGLVVGENPRNGFARDNVFYHPEFRFKFDVPAGWQLRNESSAVYLLSPKGQAMLAFQASDQGSPNAATQSLIETLKLQLTHRQERQINGWPAITIEGVAQSETGSKPISFTALEFRDQIFSFLAYGSEPGFSLQRPSISNVVSSFQTLSDPSVLNIQPSRIDIVKASKTAPFGELLPNPLPADTDARDWAIMNQLELDETVQRGALVKLPAQ